jgi:hypothetical protein
MSDAQYERLRRDAFDQHMSVAALARRRLTEAHTEYQIPHRLDHTYTIPDHVGDIVRIIKDSQ